MASRVFDDITRVDGKPARHGEGRFEFLNRSATLYFERVRELVEEWFSHFPLEHRASLRGALRADDDHSAAAFWELYLHEAYRRSNFEIEIHPEVLGRPTRPDFRLKRDNGFFYLEAVSVGRPPEEVAEDRRLEEVYRILTEMKVEDFSLDLSAYRIGPRSLPTRGLRDALRGWLAGLDPDQVSAAAVSSLQVGGDSFHEFLWEADGWRLEFRALPRGAWARGTPRPALGIMGRGEVRIVDNVTGIRRALSKKRGRYGVLDAPLVIAVQSNTEFPTQDYEVANALYGVSPLPPSERAGSDHRLIAEGFWIGRAGWQNAEVPQVLTICGLEPWTVTKVQPLCWKSPDPGVTNPDQPNWLAPMILGSDPLPGDAASIVRHFGLAEDWPGMVNPDFDLS